MGTVRKRGQYFQVDYYYRGKRYRETVKTRSKRIAESYLTEKLSNKILTEITGIEKISFTDYKIIYLDYISKEFRPRTHELYNMILNSFEVYLNNTRCVYLLDINRDIINNYKYEVSQRLTPNSIHIYLRTLRAFFNEAIKRKYLKENPLKEVAFPKISERPSRKLSIEQYKRIILEARLRYPNPKKDSFVPALMTYVYTGCRKSELLNLKWEQIDMSRRVMYIYSIGKFNTKTRKQRRIPLHPKIIEQLSKLERKSEYIFYSPNARQYTSRFYLKFKAIVRHLGLDWVKLHDLRHSIASHLAERGVSYTVIANILGHKDISTTLKYYQHTVPPEVKQAIELLPDWELV